MKTNAFFLSILMTFISLTAWSQDESYTGSYFIGNRPLATINTSFIEVSFCKVNWRLGENIAVSYGQTCLARPALITNRAFLQQCNGLTDERGELVFFYEYIAGLIFIDSQGLELIQVMDNASDGDSSPRSSKYLFKRKFPVGQTAQISGGR